MKKALKGLLIGATVVTAGVVSMVKKGKATPKKKAEKEVDILPVLTESNDTEEFVERMKQRAASKKAARMDSEIV